MKDANAISAFFKPTCHVLKESLHPTQSLDWTASENEDFVRQVC